MVYQAVNPYRVQGINGRPPRFKAAGKRPVKGGRWGVRQKLDGKWRAWSHGAASRCGANFFTWDYAVKWAHYVADYYFQRAEKREPIDHSYLIVKRKQFRELDRVLFESRPRRIDMKAYPNRRQNHP